MVASSIKQFLSTPLLATLFFTSQMAYAVSSIQVSVGSIDSPLGQIKDAQFHLDLKGKNPNLNLILFRLN